MMLVILNGEYRISEESHNNDVGELSNTKLCSTEGVNLESNGDKWVKYAMIRYKININRRGGRLLLAETYCLTKMNVVICRSQIDV